PPEWFGGTPQYMSPEQRVALAAVRARRPVFPTVDGRSDIYSLGLVLYEALGGTIPASGNPDLPRLDCCNPRVTVGLADLVHQCLARAPPARYADAAALPAALRRYLADLPLRGVANRSFRERWLKWHRRQPHRLARAGMVCGILLALVTSLTFT